MIRNKDEVEISTDPHTHSHTQRQVDGDGLCELHAFVCTLESSVWCSCSFVLIFTYHIIHYISRLSNARPNKYILNSIKLLCLLHVLCACVLCVLLCVLCINFMWLLCRFFALRYMPIIIFLSLKAAASTHFFRVQSFVFLISKEKCSVWLCNAKRVSFNDYDDFVYVFAIL